MATVCWFKVVAGFAWLLTGCDADGSGQRTTVYDNAGPLCLVQDGAQAVLYAMSNACNCASIRSSVCSAVVAAERVEVSSRTVIVTNTEAELCPTGCETRSVRCDVGFPARGRYEIVHGSEQVSVVFPTNTPVHILGPLPGSDCGDVLDALAADNDGGL